MALELHHCSRLMTSKIILHCVSEKNIPDILAVTRESNVGFS